MKRSISLRISSFCNLVPSYEAYFKALRESNKNWNNLHLEGPSQSPKFAWWYAFICHVTRILFARLHSITRTGSITTAFQNIWDPFVVEVFDADKLLGYCFVERQSINVFQISAIANMKQETDCAEPQILSAVKIYLKSLGAVRVFVRTSIEETKTILKLSNFKSGFQDDILFLDL